MDRYPQAMLTAEQVCRRFVSFFFSSRNDVPVLEMTVFVNICQDLLIYWTILANIWY